METYVQTLERHEATHDMIEIIIGDNIGFGDGKLHAKQLSETELKELGDTTKAHIKKVEKSAFGVCMDGRCAACTLDSGRTQLGPKCAGGPLQSAYAAAELIDNFFGVRSAETAEGRADEVATILKANGVQIGGHTTLSAKNNNYKNPETGEEQTGCGAAEKHAPAIRKILQNNDLIFNVADKMFSNISHGSFDKSQNEKQRTNSILDTYSPKKMLDLERTHGGDNNVEVLEGSHEELAVVLNYVRGTTVDRDAMVRESNKEVFGIDMWYLQDLAKALSRGRPDAEEIYEPLLYAMCAYQIAVYSELCDGSHPVLFAQSEFEISA